MLVWQLAHDADVVGRVEAIDALGARLEREADARQAVVTAVRDDSLWMVRARAVAALATLTAQDSVRAAVLSGTRDPDARVREAAALALARASGHADAANRLRALANNDRSWWVRTAAMRAIETVDSTIAFDVARAMVQHEEWRDMARVAALDALGRIRSPESRAIIVEHLTSGGRPGRIAAIDALAAHAGRVDSTAARVIEPMLDDPDPFIRAAAAGALARIGDASTVETLRAHRTSEQEPRVRAALDQALRRLGT
jgi:aminopeptidase N